MKYLAYRDMDLFIYDFGKRKKKKRQSISDCSSTLPNDSTTTTTTVTTSTKRKSLPSILSSLASRLSSESSPQFESAVSKNKKIALNESTELN
jgi:hypothetical protein